MINPRGPTTTDTYRVHRGGTWGDMASQLNVAARGSFLGSSNYTGFRVARSSAP